MTYECVFNSDSTTVAGRSIDSTLMLHTFLLIWLAAQTFHPLTAYNLVIDTQRKGINSYFQSLRRDYEQLLEGYEIPTVSKKRFLGKIELTEITVQNVTVESTSDILAETDHYLKIEHLHARLHGLYKHNVLFIHNTGDFEINIRDLNATLGPFVPVNIKGIPYLNQEILCSISHKEDKMSVRGGILRWLAKKRLKSTMEEDLEGIFCDSLVGILDKEIRGSLAKFNLLLPVNEAITVSYLLSGQPLLLPNGAVRTFHKGVTADSHVGANFTPTTIDSDHDVIYQIHENLLSEIVQAVCRRGFIDGNFTSDEKDVLITCQKAFITVRNMETTKTANILLTLLLRFHDGEETILTKKYSVTVLYNNQLKLQLRLKSEIIDTDDRSKQYSEQMFSILSEVFRSRISLPLPLPLGAQAERAMISLQPDRIIFATDFVFPKR
ncbi:unnamed protein product [Cylicocyclus nassatus]|uniref:BPI2 domain-containing protein n=1 Tax=Cylicocyclus nassatus TaxID=53992 RepID=A0AA36H8M6_CYLNA|nr:unnamed protein product [Cylicocyclus nassatus]